MVSWQLSGRFISAGTKLVPSGYVKIAIENGGLMGFNQQNGDFNGINPLVIFNIAIEHEPFIVDLPIMNGGSFQFAM